ncbi:hypothetical protein FCIRC_10293 [Fusarium circinatum]|uniref:Uncharacterized protein n=1 Tax=Fusarium circinatum TaxID=48490 RepID=A0A8H5TAD2_FUSCI|nr:hypothetical protein FCIRC_10293 [Fusarium circinatum]
MQIYSHAQRHVTNGSPRGIFLQKNAMGYIPRILAGCLTLMTAHIPPSLLEGKAGEHKSERQHEYCTNTAPQPVVDGLRHTTAQQMAISGYCFATVSLTEHRRNVTHECLFHDDPEGLGTHSLVG